RGTRRVVRRHRRRESNAPPAAVNRSRRRHGWACAHAGHRSRRTETLAIHHWSRGDVDVGAQRQPHVPLFHAVFDSLSARAGRSVRDPSVATWHARCRTAPDVLLEFRQPRATRTTPPTPTRHGTPTREAQTE